MENQTSRVKMGAFKRYISIDSNGGNARQLSQPYLSPNLLSKMNPSSKILFLLALVVYVTALAIDKRGEWSQAEIPPFDVLTSSPSSGC